uniref:Deoxynucleoside triphosphate triphosphohydrolase SAMHD1 n=1 Tax=Echeneis naucrates TaxID=173247 RepID=A0A665T5X0_ECHNA
VKMINTPQFNRLRYIKQMAGAYFVFPGACHNRFEHSIGYVCMFSKTMLKVSLLSACVLYVLMQGHGPFSHLFDQMFISKARPDKKWEHEENSVKMLDYMVRQNQLEPMMKEYGLKLPEDMEVIKEMIRGKKPEDRGEGRNEGRPQERLFLYEIVANKTNGIDVDKFDYFARDCHHLGIQNHFDHLRFFRSARVIKCPDGLMHICSRDKEVHNLYAMFYARCSFHRKACQHKTNKLIETMITDAFLKANKHIMTEGSGGKSYCLSEAIDDMQAYTKLTDRVFEDILFSSSEQLRDAKNILHRVITRDLYKCVGKLETGTKFPQAVKLDYGMKDKDPIGEVFFYSKSDNKTAFNIPRDQVSKLLPERFSETFIRIYCKKNEQLAVAKQHFLEWYQKNSYKILKVIYLEQVK